MNSLTPIPPRGPGFQLGAPMEINAAPPPPPKFRLKKFLFFLRKFWWIPVITLILAVGAAVTTFVLSPPEFVSVASLWQTERLQLPDGAAFAEDQDNFFGTMTAVFTSPKLADLALKRLSDTDTNFASLYRDGNAPDVNVTVSQATRGQVFYIQAISANPAFTPAYLNALVNSYLDYKRNVRKDVSGGTLASITTQISALQEEMKMDQDALDEYEQSNNLVVLQQESQVAGDYLAKLNTQLADYQLQNRLLDAVALEKNTTLLAGTNGANPLFEQIAGGGSGSSPVSSSQDAYQQIASLKFQRAKLSKYLRPDHPKIVELDKQIAQAQNLLDLYSSENATNIVIARAALAIRMESVKEAITNWEAKVDFDSGRMAEAQKLQDKVTSNKSMLDRLSSLMENVNITQNIDQDNLEILNPAIPASRSYDKLKSNLSTAALGGLALGLGIVLLLAVRDDRFATILEVNERIGDSVVGQVPEIPELQRGVPLALLGDGDEKHMYVESYRSLRSALLYFAVDGERPKVLLITSAVPAEGKSTIASNLACAMALGGSKVLLIDCDLRRGRLHDLFGLQSKPGVAEMLLQALPAPEELDQHLNKFIQSSAMTNLSIIARGSGQRNPGDLFLSNAFDTILGRLRNRYDYIVIDSSPVFAADDSTTLAPKADGTLFVVRSRFSRSGIVKEALELLYQRQATVLGLILNRTDASDRSYHYYKYSEYHTSDET
jgi:succinoglycan biosynthesis transport protein ExoP